MTIGSQPSWQTENPGVILGLDCEASIRVLANYSELLGVITRREYFLVNITTGGWLPRMLIYPLLNLGSLRGRYPTKTETELARWVGSAEYHHEIRFRIVRALENVLGESWMGISAEAILGLTGGILISDDLLDSGSVLPAVFEHLMPYSALFREKDGSEGVECIRRPTGPFRAADGVPLCVSCGTKMRPAGEATFVCEGCGSVAPPARS